MISCSRVQVAGLLSSKVLVHTQLLAHHPKALFGGVLGDLIQKDVVPGIRIVQLLFASPRLMP